MSGLYCIQLLLLIAALAQRSDGLMMHRSQRAARAHHPSRGAACFVSPCCLSKTPQQEQEEESQFDSLDIVLDRARKRNQVPLLLGKFQSSVLGRKVLPFLSVGDVFIVLTALVILDAKGFAIGLLIGKATLDPLRKLLVQQGSGTSVVKVVDFYPVLLAIALDQIV